ncbi:alpha-L-fucosidase [Nocardioides sp. KC13]|uniref:alpha-L-fucosidase n=1 Tax=Nocardioides turkmenicus TaxID=2711220 RepID=A0A6M1R476_9ACTN|nr:alpha-L-fucosidase [Nocardioides sp. KC13]NGN94840.1 alpha-L-fucosidase [Nocardioides sp. KC13]
MTIAPWFPEAKLGIFVHWGIYSVDGVAESWSFYDGRVPYPDYMSQIDRFTASAFDADAWAELFERAGATYAVLTAKHHDGVALYDTDANDLSVVRRAPAGRDLVAEFVTAVRRRGLKVGLYFSHLDWSHPDYATVRPAVQHPVVQDNPYAVPRPGAEEPERWERYLEFHRAQIRELVTRFAPDLLWFDGEWERDERQWRMRELRAELRELAPEMVVNGRMLGHGDYVTPEQGVPVEPPEGPWELCLTINDSWGWQPQDDNHKSPRQIVRTFVETIGGGGNLLLDVGPREDGTITPEQTERLEALGAWVSRHSPAVRGIRRGLPHGHFYGPTAVSDDGRTLFLYVLDRPNDYVVVRGLRNQVLKAYVLGTGTELEHQRVGGLHEVPGWEYVFTTDDDLDPLCTVIALDLDGEVSLYRPHEND